MMLGLVLAGAPLMRAQSDADLQQLLAEGNAAVKSGEFDTAIARYQKVLESLDPDSASAGDLQLRLGETYRRKGDFDSAIRSLARANDLLPGNPVIVGTLALALDSSGNRADAQRAYRAAIDLDANNAIAMNNLAFLLAEGGTDLDEALRLARRAMELTSSAADVTDTAGWVHLKRGENDQAIALFADAVAKEPAEESYRDHLLMALERKGDREGIRGETIAALKQVSSPENLAKVSALIQGLK
jgi:Flp pilus assembly protein TadD